MWKNKISQGFDLILLFHLYLLVFLVPLFLLPGVRLEQAPIKNKELALGFIATSLLSVYIIYSIFFSPLRFPRISLTNLAILFFWFFIFLTALLSTNITYCLKEGRLLILSIIVFFLSQVIVKTHIEANRVKNSAIFSALLVALYGICQYLNWDFLQPIYPLVGTGIESRTHIFSTIGNPEYLGSYIAAIAVLLVPGFILFRPGSVVYWLNLCFFLIFLLVILLTGARGAFIGLIISSFLILIICVKNRLLRLTKTHYIITTGIVFFLLIVVIIFSFPNPINFRNADVLGRLKALVNIRDDSIKERLLFYSVGAEMITDHPVFGIGAGMFKVQFYPYIKKLVDKDPRAGMQITLMDLKNRVPDNAHNDLLQFWIEYGSFGFFAFMLALIAHFVKLLARVTIPEQNTDLVQLELALGGAVFCLAINAAVSFPLHTPERLIIFWVFWGLSHKLIHSDTAQLSYRDEKEN